MFRISNIANIQKKSEKQKYFAIFFSKKLINNIKPYNRLFLMGWTLIPPQPFEAHQCTLKWQIRHLLYHYLIVVKQIYTKNSKTEIETTFF